MRTKDSGTLALDYPNELSHLRRTRPYITELKILSTVKI